MTGKRIKTDQDFRDRIESRFPDADFDLSETVFTGRDEQATINCLSRDSDGNPHGKFSRRAREILSGRGCPKCMAEETLKSKREAFIEQASKRYNNKFDYSDFIYVDNRTKGLIRCPIHGEKMQTPSNHLHYEHGCDECGTEATVQANTRTTKDFIQAARKVHGRKYIYDKTAYEGRHEKLTITCKQHGDFEQIAGNHLDGHGCPHCR